MLICVNKKSFSQWVLFVESNGLDERVAEQLQRERLATYTNVLTS